MKAFYQFLLFCLFSASGAISPVANAATPAAEEEGYVWIMDARFDLPFCRVRVPASWKVEGNVAWALLYPVMSWSSWLRLTDPAGKVVHEVAGPLGVFQWDIGITMTPEKVKAIKEADARFNRENATFHWYPRHPSMILEKYVLPLAKRLNPGLESEWLRSDKGIYQRLAESLIEAIPVPAIDGDGAAMLVRFHDRRTLFASAVVMLNQSAFNTNIVWEWVGVEAMTTPAEIEPTAGDSAAFFKDRVCINPEWQRRMEEAREQERSDYHPDNTWPVTDYRELYGQAYHSGKMLWSKRDGDQDQVRDGYRNPPGDAVEIRPKDSYGFANAMVETFVLHGPPYGIAIENLPLEDTEAE